MPPSVQELSVMSLPVRISEKTLALGEDPVSMFRFVFCFFVFFLTRGNFFGSLIL